MGKLNPAPSPVKSLFFVDARMKGVEKSIYFIFCFNPVVILTCKQNFPIGILIAFIYYFLLLEVFLCASSTHVLKLFNYNSVLMVRLLSKHVNTPIS